MDVLKTEYERELSKTRRMLENIKSIDINVLELNRELEDIVKQDVVNSGGKQVIKEINYSSAIKEIKVFQKRLESFDVLFKIKNSTIYLNEFVTKEINEKVVDKATDEILTSLTMLRECDIELLSEIDNTVTLLFDTAYNIIKLECIYNGKSKVLDFIVNSEVYITQINNRILQDVENLSSVINDVNGFSNLKAVMFERSKMGTLTHYVSNDVINALVVCTSLDKVKENVSNRLISFYENAVNIKGRLYDSVKKSESSVREIETISEKKQKSLHDLRKRLMIMLISGGIIGSITYASHYLAKNFATYRKCMTTTTTITLEDGKTEENLGYQDKIQEGYQVQIEVSNKYTPVFIFSDEIRTLTYDVTEEFPQGKEYTFDDFSFLEKKSPINSEITETLNSLTEEEIELIKEVYKYIVTTQDLEDEIVTFDEKEYKGWLKVFVILAIIIYALVLWGFDFEYLPEEISNFFGYMRSEAASKKDLKEVLLSGFDMIKSNDKLKSEFLEFYKNNKKVIDEYSASLYKEANDVFDSSEELKLKLEQNN